MRLEKQKKKTKKKNTKEKKLRHDSHQPGWYISINQSGVVEHLHVRSIWYRHLHKSLCRSGAPTRVCVCACVRGRVCVLVDLHGSSIQHLALSLRALFQDEDGFLSV